MQFTCIQTTKSLFTSYSLLDICINFICIQLTEQWLQYTSATYIQRHRQQLTFRSWFRHIIWILINVLVVCFYRCSMPDIKKHRILRQWALPFVSQYIFFKRSSHAQTYTNSYDSSFFKNETQFKDNTKL